MNKKTNTVCFACHKSLAETPEEQEDIQVITKRDKHGSSHIHPLTEEHEIPQIHATAEEYKSSQNHKEDRLVTYEPKPKNNETIALIKILANLHANGILTDEEFNAKKSDLLSRI